MQILGASLDTEVISMKRRELNKNISDLSHLSASLREIFNSKNDEIKNYVEE